MKISVVIPAHNEESSIEHTLCAVLAQSYPDFEVIVVNNASTDRTHEVVSQFPVRLVFEPKKGILWARERGRKEARGEIIVNIDADCLPDPDWLSRGHVHFSDANIAAVTGPYDYHDAGLFSRKFSLLIQQYIYKSVSEIGQLPFVRRGEMLIGGNNFIRASVLEKVGGYNTALVFYGEDTDTAQRVSKHGRILFAPKLTMKTSARRFKKEGTIKVQLRYLYYFFKHTFAKKNSGKRAKVSGS